MHDRATLIGFIQQILAMPESNAVTISAHFKDVLFEKNSFLLEQGDIANDFLFLETGAVRAFTFDTEGDEVTTNFYMPPIIVFEVASFIKRIPSGENFQALTECSGWKVDFDTFQVLFHSIPEFREFGRANLVNGFIALKERTLSMINQTAEQRYEHLIRNRPDIFRTAALKHIASYLGITDTSLSRIRKEAARK